MSSTQAKLTASPLASGLFFLSGGTALAYQVIWFKRFSHLWGNSSFAMAAVVAGFLFGLGLGARLLSAFADRTSAPLAWYGVFEIGIAVLALAVPHELAALQAWTARWHEGLQEWPIVYTLLRFAVSALVLGPPCMLMGATLPLLVRQFSSQGLARATGWFYAINTAGAATGCYLTGFHFLPNFGLANTHMGAVALNMVVGSFAIWLGRGARLRMRSEREPGQPAIDAFRLNASLAWAATLIGAGALLLQMSWARQLALLLGGTTYAFTAVVMIVLIGIGVGSGIVRARFREDSDLASWLFATTLMLVLGVWAGQAALPYLAAQVGELRAARSSASFNASLCVGVSAAVELLPSIASGVLFPLLVHLTGVKAAGAGRAVGRVYAYNTVGTTLGAVLTSWILFRLLGAGGAVLLATACYVVATTLLLRGHGLRIGAQRTALIGGACLLLVVSTVRRDWLSTRLGQYLYGPDIVQALSVDNVLFHREGTTCDVLVTELDGHVNLRVNGKVDASTYESDQLTQLGTAYLPRLMIPDARDILVIGHGSGASAGASLLFPGTRRVDCVEIEPAVFEASAYFRSINHEPEASDRFEMIIDDGRSHLLGTTRTYDLILTEPSNPWMAGIANLFTHEFYLAVKARLNEDGILGQWIQTYSLTVQEYALVLRTVAEVFPNTVLLVLTDGDTMLLASEQDLWPTQAELDSVQQVVLSVPAIQADLDKYFHSSDVRSLLYRHLLIGDSALTSWADNIGSGVHTDWNMRLEFEAPLHLFAPTPVGLHPVTASWLDASGKAWFRESVQRLGVGPEQWRGMLKLVQLMEQWGKPELATEALETALAVAPGHPELLAQGLLLSQMKGEPAWWHLAGQLIANAPQAINRIAVVLGKRERLDLAAGLFESLIDNRPDSVTLHVNLATIYADQERINEARAILDKALVLNPRDADALRLRSALRE
ncbi:MAG: spermidine synthase [Planctomycetota bacterium]